MVLKGDLSWVHLHDGNPQWGAPYSQNDRKMRDDEFADFLKSVKGWNVDEKGAMTKSFIFQNSQMTYEWMSRVMAFAWWTDKYPELTLTGNTATCRVYSGRFQGITHKEARLVAFLNDQAFMLKKIQKMSEDTMERAQRERERPQSILSRERGREVNDQGI